jgi:AcrR family transcriptional regulator
VPPRKKASSAARSRPPSDEAPSRREQILEEGLMLIGERGVAGGSLRELARRVGISQPSLYHHFPTKDALVAEIVRHGVKRMAEKSVIGGFPERLDQLPRVIADICLDLYRAELHPTYVRFLFAVCIEQPAYRPLVQQVFTELMMGAEWMAQAFVGRGGISTPECVNLIKLLINAFGFPLLEERALWGLRQPTPELHAYIDGVVRMLAEMIRLRWPEPAAPLTAP